MSGPELLGVCKFDLYLRNPGPHRPIYSLDVKSPLINEEELLLFSIPLFLEHNIGKIDKKTRDVVIEQIGLVGAAYMNEQAILIPTEPRSDEILAARFIIELFQGKRIYINIHYKQFTTDYGEKIDVNKAFILLFIGVFCLAIYRFDNKNRELLFFFITYGIKKWNQYGYPKAITAFNPTWDFSNINKMVEEFKNLM